MPSIRPASKRRGFAIIYITMSSLVLIPMAGLAIDFGMLYNIKARLQTACDAAAIGAGYLLHATTDITNPTQLSAITSTAQQYFNANFPTHYMGSTVTYYNAGVSGSTAGKSVTVNATVSVPMLLMRVLRINNSTVSAMAVSNVKYIAMMIVVDRSGSVYRAGSGTTIKTALSTFVATASTSFLVDGVDTVGMVSFGGTWKLDFTPAKTFQSGSPNIQTAINNLAFDTGSSTNTAEGLYQAWAKLYQIYLPGALNVIVLLTDGRPSAFTSYWTPYSGSSCTNKTQRAGVFTTNVGIGSYPFWPPPTSGSSSSTGLFATQFQGAPESDYFAANSASCAYASNSANVDQDFSGGNFPSMIGPVDNVGASYVPTYLTAGAGISSQCGYYPLANSSGVCTGTAPGTSMNNPRAGRYASFNAADNIARLIRSDTTLSPMLFVIGLNYSGTSEEPLDEDWLARVANDPNYVTVGSDTTVVAAGQSVYQTGQTPGLYCNSTTATLTTCFQQVTSHLLRLMQ